MSRWEFMRQLEDLLSDIPPGEREEALQYYNDYFNDAGRQNEQEVIKALGTPEQVAQIVKDGISGNGDSGEFTENGFLSASASDRQELMKRTQGSSAQNGGRSGGSSEYRDNNGRGTYTNSNNGSTYGGSSNGNGGYTGSNNSSNGSNSSQNNNAGSGYGSGSGERSGTYGEYTGRGRKSYKKEEMPPWAIVLIVLGCIVLAPILLGILSTAFGIIVGIFGTVLGLVFGAGLAAVILFVVAVALIIAGFGCLWGHPLTGIGLLGGGLICGALGILFMLFTAFLVIKCIPGVYKGIRYLFRNLFGKKRGR